MSDLIKTPDVLMEEWLSEITEVLRDLPQTNHATSVSLWNRRAAYFNAKLQVPVVKEQAETHE